MTDPSPTTEGLSREARAGLVLVAAALCALVIANSPLAQAYFEGLESKLALGIAPFVLSKTVLHWINDGLMVVFFFLVGLEIKREVKIGALSNRKSAALPAIAALGGMIVPALIYSAINWGDPAAMRGWAIPAATDIAFAVGVLALLGSRIPASLKVFLLALAIIDDLGAILIIAVFYSADLSLMSLGLAAAGLALLAILNARGVTRISPYILVGLFVWLCVLKSGVHATIAGVAVALTVPIAGAADGREGPLERLEHGLSPWVSFAILPIFAFANAGVSLKGISAADLLTPIPLGIALGLFFGKMIGIFSFSEAAIRSGLAHKPAGSTALQMLGISVLGGIGFTMSLFIGTLAFPDPVHATDLRLGVLSGSLLSAVAGYIILARAAKGRP